MKDIFSELRGEVLRDKWGEIRVYLYARGVNTLYNPSLVLTWRLQVERLRDYLNEVLEKNPLIVKEEIKDD
jgi:hypothetical protein